VLEITAWVTENNQQEIMALRHKTLAIASVQFHPESVLTEQGHQLLQNFIDQYADQIDDKISPNDIHQ
jgi:anthranilate/para-aminobenzoate synthase component II